jgi:membrane protein implicated in regulation of membrane protease activity
MDPELLSKVYLVCFLVGGTVMVCQFLLSLFGLGGHHDVGDGHDVGHDFHAGDHDTAHDAHGHDQLHDAAQNWFVGVLTFRTITAALTFFGLGGLATVKSEMLGAGWSAAVAAAAGLGALFLVAWIMRSLSRLQSEGTARIERAVGQSGTVYLTVPGNKTGLGKVQLNLQNRTVEYQAVTPQQTLPTGTKIVVTAVVGKDTVEVAPAPDTGSTSHA